MSSDQRVKKLRGSGGYVTAVVSDEQQRRGNLGGPDLFLAPIGRLDSEKISKHFCNTCEKDYEGSPRIEFENPNEEVAENLVLAERGQYICTVCESTIAEYRDFKKPDESSDVGLANPIDSAAQTESEIPAVTPEINSQLQNIPENIQTEIPAVQPESGQISPIAGMSVFGEDGIKVGTAKQIGVDASRNLVLVVTRDDGGESAIPWSQIKKVGEIILLGDGSKSETQDSGACPDCGCENKSGSKFCEQCGNKL